MSAPQAEGGDRGGARGPGGGRGADGSPCVGGVISRLIVVEPEELPAVGLAFALFFCVMGGYFAVRPVRETVGTILGRERVADLFVVTWAASLIIVPVYGAIVAHLRRRVFLPLVYLGIAVALALVGSRLEGTTGAEQIRVGQFFYVFISVLNLFVVSVFWSFLLELFTSHQSQRLFGFIAAGGTAGALCGPLITDLAVGRIGNSGVLYLGAALFVCAIGFQWLLLRLWSARASEPHALDRPIGGNPFAGLTLVLRSPYLLGISLFVVLLATVSTFLYFEQLRLVEQEFPNVADRTRIFARLDWIVQSLTIVAQIFWTGRIASRLGVVVLLTLVPVAMVLGFGALALSGTFMTLAIVFVLRRAGEYAFVRPGREILFSPLGVETKYKAKNLIDVPVYRGADALAAQVSRLLSSGGYAAWVVALIGALVSAAWAANGWLLGRRYRTIADHTSRAG